jgi:hypothetical protein
MRPVVRPKLVDKILDMEVDGRFGDPQLIGDLLIALAVANQPENLELSFRKIIVGDMFGETRGRLRRHMPFTGMNGADHPQHLILRRGLKDVCRSPDPTSLL